MAALLRYSIAGADELELDPMPPIPMPKLAEPVPPEAGPVLVTVEYAIDPGTSTRIRGDDAAASNNPAVRRGEFLGVVLRCGRARTLRRVLCRRFVDGAY